MVTSVTAVDGTKLYVEWTPAADSIQVSREDSAPTDSMNTKSPHIQGMSLWIRRLIEVLRLCCVLYHETSFVVVVLCVLYQIRTWYIESLVKYREGYEWIM